MVTIMLHITFKENNPKGLPGAKVSIRVVNIGESESYNSSALAQVMRLG
jgi:hypothetical protein